MKLESEDQSQGIHRSDSRSVMSIVKLAITTVTKCKWSDPGSGLSARHLSLGAPLAVAEPEPLHLPAVLRESLLP